MTEENPDTPAPRRSAVLLAGIVVLIGVAFAAWQWLTPPQPPAAPTAPPTAAEPPAPREPAIANPIAAPPDAPVAPTAADLETALMDLAGAELVQSLFRLPDLPRRIVSTIDNLGRAQASSGLWPVSPPSGNFTTDRSGVAEVIATANYARYTRHVEALESVDLVRAAQAYGRLYPVLQRAYEDLGYPGQYFNDRLVAVIDLLLATPDATGPRAVRLPEFGADVKPERPWVLYEYADPALQSLSAGQRILLRMGPEHLRRVKARLKEIRAQVATAPIAG